MQDQLTIAIAELEHVAGGKRMPKAPALSTKIDAGMIDPRQPSRPGPTIDSGMIDFRGKGHGAPRIDSGMIGGGPDFRAPSTPIDYGPSAPRNMPR